MSNDRIAYVPPRARQPMTPAERITHIGELALAWARAAEAFESEYTVDMKRRRDLMRARDAAEERLRTACLVALAANPNIGSSE